MRKQLFFRFLRQSSFWEMSSAPKLGKPQNKVLYLYRITRRLTAALNVSSPHIA